MDSFSFQPSFLGAVLGMEVTAPFEALAIFFFLVGVTSILILTTPKGSVLRYLWIPCSLWMSYEFFLLAPGFTASSIRNSKFGIIAILTTVLDINLLVINPLDRDVLAQHNIWQPSVGIIPCMRRVIPIVMGYRGASSPWQAKNTPLHPAFFARRGMQKSPSRGLFVLRQSVFLAWQCLVLDVLYHQMVEERQTSQLPTEFKYFGISLEEWRKRMTESVMTWFFTARLMIDSAYRLLTVVIVTLGLSSSEECPPLFGSMWDAYTLRNYWGKFWHQMLRWPFTSISNLVARDMLRLPRPSIIERYTNIFIVFFLSGLLHIWVDEVGGVPSSRSYAVWWFTSFAVGIVIEDTAQELWRRWSGNRERKSAVTSLWRKVVGFIWVGTWFTLTCPRYMHEIMSLPLDGPLLVPFSAMDYMGVSKSAAFALVVVGGAILKIGFGGEE